MSRPSWEETWYAVAETMAKRSTCPRLHTAAVAVNMFNQLLSVGYNGSLPGAPHCEDVGCDVVDGHCQRTIHAERNLIISAATNGVSLLGATVYVLHTPCSECEKLLMACRVAEIKHRDSYQSAPGTLTERLYTPVPNVLREEVLVSGAEIEVNERGAKQSAVGVRLDLIPQKALLDVAAVFHTGALKYGVDNWHGIAASAHLNHALRHILLDLSADMTETHLANAATRVLMAMWARLYGPLAP